MIRCKPYVFWLHACIFCGDTGPLLTLLDLAVDGESVLRQQVRNKKVWTSEADSSPFSDADIFFFSCCILHLLCMYFPNTQVYWALLLLWLPAIQFNKCFWKSDTFKQFLVFYHNSMYLLIFWTNYFVKCEYCVKHVEMICFFQLEISC